MPNWKDLITPAPSADDQIDAMGARIIELEDALGRCNRFLADLNGCEWIKGGDAGSIDMRQRARNMHQIVSSMLGDRATGEKGATASLMVRRSLQAREDNTLDDDHPLALVNAQIVDLLEGLGASEDHENVLAFLLETGLPESTVRRVHKAICHGDTSLPMVLRFVEREEESRLAADGRMLPPGVVHVIKRHVLQQYLARTYGRGEWRDVPMVRQPRS